MSALINSVRMKSLSKTDVSAIISVLLFSMTILISAVGPAEAQGTTIAEDGTISPTVSYKA